MLENGDSPASFRIDLKLSGQICFARYAVCAIDSMC